MRKESEKQNEVYVRTSVLQMSHIQNTALEVATASVHPLSHLDNTRLKQSLLYLTKVGVYPPSMHSYKNILKGKQKEKGQGLSQSHVYLRVCTSHIFIQG